LEKEKGMRRNRRRAMKRRSGGIEQEEGRGRIG
jgi:hypothetical protein